MSWDEPLFYNYAESIRTAYTPEAFSPDFNFYQVYGKSPEDHKIYGPAYLLIAQPFQLLAKNLFNTDTGSAWHFINFITFQIGLIGFYVLSRRWLEPWVATVSTAFLGWQPVFWGHAFINPKDIPFMVLFLLSIVIGMDFVDHLEKQKKTLIRLIPAAIMLGLASSTRIIGPLAGIVVFAYFLLKNKNKYIFQFILYGLISVLVMFFFWPYLWSEPFTRIMEVLKHMSNNPTELAVLFNGQIFRANDMPRRYLPQMFALTLTEPTWLLFFLGCIYGIRQSFLKKIEWRSLGVVAGYFVFMVTYLIYNKPSVYDGFRHFIFITPPIFIIIGLSFKWISEKFKSFSLVLIIFSLLPGILGIIQSHPYEYTYFNQFSNGVGGAFRVYETDYWLTCYKEAIEWTGNNFPTSTLHIQREYPLAEYYGKTLKIKDLGSENEDDIQSGDLLLFHTRANLDIRSIYRKLRVIHVIGKNSAEFCIIKIKD
jgi:hypothetical protein